MNPIRLTRIYITRLAGCASCLASSLANGADENGFLTKHLVARRALISTQHAVKAIQVAQNAVHTKMGDFNAIVQYEGAPPMTVNGCLDLTLERLAKAEEHIAEYLESPTADEGEKELMRGLQGWVRHCYWDINDIRKSPKPALNYVIYGPLIAVN